MEGRRALVPRVGECSGRRLAGRGSPGAPGRTSRLLRALFKSRVTPEIYGLNLYDRAIIDVMIKSKGHVKSRIW